MINQEIKHYVGNLFEPVAVVDNELKILYCNNMFSTLFKAPPRVIEKIDSICELFVLNNSEEDQLFRQNVKANELALSEEVTLSLSREPKIKFILVLKFIPLKKGEMIIAFNDLTVEKNLYDKYKDQFNELKNTHQQILQADKLASIGELTAGISHEISNPLTIASGGAEIIQACCEFEDMNEVKEMIETNVLDISESLERIQKIIMGMKSYLHSSEDKREYCRLADVIEKTVVFVLPTYNETGVKIKTEIEDPNIVGLINPIKIEQVLVNLATNALDAIRHSKISNGEVIISLKRGKDQFVEIILKDNGPGIPVELQEKVFDIFFTTKEVGEGTGLGLAICQKIANAHAGELRLDSTKKGTQFTLSLPGIETSSYLHNDKYLNGLIHSPGKKVLVVDNEVQILNIFQTFLEQDSYVFIGSTSAEEALKVIDQIIVDLVITDYNMPGMNASEFMNKVRKSGNEVPALYLTSNDHIDKFKNDQEKFKLEGLILKPFTKEEVLKTINSVLAKYENS